MATNLETSVVVVGGSLVGLSAALFLSHWKVPVILLERHEGSSPHPRAVGYTTRTIELLQTAGAAEKLTGIQWSGGPPRRAIVESLSGKWMQESAWTQAGGKKDPPATPLKGAPASASSSKPGDFKSYSHVEGVAIAQDKIEPVLRSRALELGADLRLGYTVNEWSQDDEGVTAKAVTREGSELNVKAKYLIACDGARSPIREKLGIKRHGVGLFRGLRSILFRCQPMQKYLDHGYSQFQIEGREDGFEAFLTTYGDGRWMLAWNEEAADGAATVPDEAAQKDWVRKASGMDLADDDISLITTAKWDIGGLIADSFSSGRVFLAGDSAHSLPPNRGGYGANTGIADAHNLAWKLASVLGGHSLPALLDTYDAERRSVADVRHDQVFARDDHRRFVKDREWPGKNVDVLDDVAIEFGQRIESKAIIAGPGDEKDQSLAKRPEEWAGQPGIRAPHVVLTSNGQATSTLNFFGTNWVVISQDQAWRDLAMKSAQANGVEVDFVPIGGDIQEKNQGSFGQLFGLKPSGAALIRPDGIIAWRAVETSEDSQQELDGALRQASMSVKA